MDLSGKVALVTGASRGIGREISRQLAEHGARIAVHFKGNEKAAHETFSSLPGGPHAPFRADVADPDDARDLVGSVVAEMGAMDVLVNNAGTIRSRIPATKPGRMPGTERSARTSLAPRTSPSTPPAT